jgi:RNA-binding protein YhbY
MSDPHENQKDAQLIKALRDHNRQLCEKDHVDEGVMNQLQSALLYTELANISILARELSQKLPVYFYVVDEMGHAELVYSKIASLRDSVLSNVSSLLEYVIRIGDKEGIYPHIYADDDVITVTTHDHRVIKVRVIKGGDVLVSITSDSDPSIW